jgi:DNA-binding MarR family transcriptional regulator
MSSDLKIHAQRPLPALLGEVKDLALAQLHERLADEGYPDVRPGHGCVFRFVEPQGSRLTDLAERSGLTKQAVGEVVDDLMALGYIERVPDPSDARAKLIRLTAEGLEGKRTAERIFADIERRWARQVGRQRMTELRQTLAAIVAADAAGTRAA